MRSPGLCVEREDAMGRGGPPGPRGVSEPFAPSRCKPSSSPRPRPRPSRSLALALALALALVTPGCLGSVDPAHLPASALDEAGWVLVTTQKESHAAGLAEQVLYEYWPEDDRRLDGIIIGTVTNVPFYDESKLVPQALERAERDLDIDLEETGTRTVQLTTVGRSVEGTVYDMRRGVAEGKALLFEVPCDDFAVVLAYGPESSGGILFGSDENRYEEAVQLARTVEC